MKIRNKEKLFRYLFWFWFILIITLSSIPFFSAPKVEIKQFHFEIRLDYIFHFIIYLIFSIIFFLWKIKGIKQRKFHLLTVMIMLSIVLAVFDEFHQKLIPGRTFNPIDLVYNCACLFTGFIFSLIVFRRKNAVQKSRRF